MDLAGGRERFLSTLATLAEVQPAEVDLAGGRERFLSTLATLAEVQPDPALGPALTRDPDDDHVIDLARAHNGEVIVSGEADLLEWVEQVPPVIPPAEFETGLSTS